MTSKSLQITFLCWFLATGCSNSKIAYQATRGLDAFVPPAAVRQIAAKTPGDSLRHIAVSHTVVVETAESRLSAAWEAANEFCRTIRCEIVASRIVGSTPSSPASASLRLRVVPEDLQKLFDRLGQTGSIADHSIQSVDKTGEVIDAEAQIKNLGEYRDSLRAMLARASIGVKDVMDAQRELSRVQSELDGIAARRKVLANETESILVAITFQSERSVLRRGVFAPIFEAWSNSGVVLSENIASVFTFGVSILPWLLVIVPAGWFLVRLFRRSRRRGPPPEPPL
jgi:hypothetical protein